MCLILCLKILNHHIIELINLYTVESKEKNNFSPYVKKIKLYAGTKSNPLFLPTQPYVNPIGDRRIMRHKVKPIIDYVNSLGIKVLENENVYIGTKDKGFFLCGVYDRYGETYGSYKPDIKKALHNTQTHPTVVLAHQPKYIEEIETKGIDLMLCGHTHGGQIFPFNFLVKLQQPYVKGLHQHNEFTQIYINKGTGFWGPPMRLGASSEITILKLS